MSKIVNLKMVYNKNKKDISILFSVLACQFFIFLMLDAYDVFLEFSLFQTYFLFDSFLIFKCLLLLFLNAFFLIKILRQGSKNEFHNMSLIVVFIFSIYQFHDFISFFYYLKIGHGWWSNPPGILTMPPQPDTGDVVFYDFAKIFFLMYVAFSLFTTYRLAKNRFR
jgi:hypothetical protein